VLTSIMEGFACMMWYFRTNTSKSLEGVTTLPFLAPCLFGDGPQEGVPSCYVPMKKQVRHCLNPLILIVS
jgi:hypothetical protein